MSPIETGFKIVAGAGLALSFSSADKEASANSEVNSNRLTMPVHQIDKVYREILITEMADSIDGRVNADRLAATMPTNPTIKEEAERLADAINFIESREGLKNPELEAVYQGFEFDDRMFVIPAIVVRKNEGSIPPNSIALTYDTPNGVSDAVLEDTDGEGTEILVYMQPIPEIGEDGSVVFRRAQAVKATYDAETGEQVIQTILTADENGNIKEIPREIARVGPSAIRGRNIEDPTKIEVGIKAGSELIVLGTTPVPPSLTDSTGITELLTVQTILPDGKLILVAVSADVVETRLNEAFSSLTILSLSPAEENFSFPMPNTASEVVDAGLAETLDLFSVDPVEANFEYAKSQLPNGWDARIELPEGDPNRIEYSEVLGGFVNSEGHVWRGGINRTDPDQEWSVVLDLKKFTLTDNSELGEDFTWTLSLERGATDGIGKTNSQNASFPPDFGLRLNELAKKYMSAADFNGSSYHMTYAPDDHSAKGTTAMSTALQIFQSSPNYAFGYNQSSPEINPKHRYGRVFNGVDEYPLNIPDGTTEDADEAYFTDDIINMLIIATKIRPGEVPDVSRLLRSDAQFQDTYAILSPQYFGEVGFKNATRLVELS